MYKIAVFSDIHGNLEALEAILKDMKKDLYNEIIFLGDAIGLGPDSKECLNKIADSDIKWILGNHDLYFIKGTDKFAIEPWKLEHYKGIYEDLNENDRNKIKNKKIEYKTSIGKHTFTFCHYFLENRKNDYPFYGIGTIKRSKITDLLNLIDTEYIVYGHDHQGNMYHFNDKYLINVGSSGCVHKDKTYYTVIEIDEDVKINIKEVKYNRKKFEEKMKKVSYPSKEKIANDYYGIKDLQD